MDQTRNVGVGKKVPQKPFLIGGFTLIEVLIVIGIIAVVAGILFPVISQARERGRRTTCQSNLRQIAAAMQQYTQDYDGVYPETLFAYNINGVSTIVTWREVLFPYTKSREIMRCPGQGKPLPPSYHGDGYTYNDQRLNTFKWSGATPGDGILTVQGLHESDFANASTIWLNGDRIAIENQQAVDFKSSTGSCGRDMNASTLHSNGGNYSFLDGHVKWHTPDDIAELDCKNGPLPSPL